MAEEAPAAVVTSEETAPVAETAPADVAATAAPEAAPEAAVAAAEGGAEVGAEGESGAATAAEAAGEGAEGEEPPPPPDGIAIDFSIKHMLQRTWTMWYDNPGGRSAWTMDRFKKISEVGTVEDFWRMYNNIMPPSGLCNGSNYHLFKDDIQPMWEDAHNIKGGKWIVVFPKGRKDLLDEYWLYLLLGMIGESFHDVDEVCGAVVSVRKNQSKISLWTKTANRDHQETVMKIGITLRQVLQLEDKWKINYTAHEDGMKKDPPGPMYEI